MMVAGKLFSLALIVGGRQQVMSPCVPEVLIALRITELRVKNDSKKPRLALQTRHGGNATMPRKSGIGWRIFR